MNSKYLIREVLKRTTLEDVFFGGDAVHAFGTEEECLEQAEAVIIVNDLNKLILKL